MSSKPVYSLENWAAGGNRSLTLHGLRDDGKLVYTSTVIRTRGRMVETRNSFYKLIGPPTPDYVRFCEEEGLTIDYEWPIKIFTGGVLQEIPLEDCPE